MPTIRTSLVALSQIQGLPGRVATTAIFFLSGCLPFMAIFHERMLVLYGGICLLEEEHILRELVMSQLTNGPCSNSWFAPTSNYCSSIQYRPHRSSYHSMEEVNSEGLTIQNFWSTKLLTEATLKMFSLCWLHYSTQKPNNSQAVLSSCLISIRQSYCTS